MEKNDLVSRKAVYRGQDQVDSVEEGFSPNCDVESDVGLSWLGPCGYICIVLYCTWALWIHLYCTVLYWGPVDTSLLYWGPVDKFVLCCIVLGPCGYICIVLYCTGAL